MCLLLILIPRRLHGVDFENAGFAGAGGVTDSLGGAFFAGGIVPSKIPAPPCLSAVCNIGGFPSAWFPTPEIGRLKRLVCLQCLIAVSAALRFVWPFQELRAFAPAARRLSLPPVSSCCCLQGGNP